MGALLLTHLERLDATMPSCNKGRLDDRSGPPGASSGRRSTTTTGVGRSSMTQSTVISSRSAGRHCRQAPSRSASYARPSIHRDRLVNGLRGLGTGRRRPGLWAGGPVKSEPATPGSLGTSSRFERSTCRAVPALVDADAVIKRKSVPQGQLRTVADPLRPSGPGPSIRA